MSWCERNRVFYIFGLAPNKALLRRVAPLAETAALARVEGEDQSRKVRRFSHFDYAAKAGNASAMSSLGSRPAHRAPTVVLSSPTSKGHPAGSMRPSIVQGDRQKI